MKYNPNECKSDCKICIQDMRNECNFYKKAKRVGLL